MTKPMIRPPSGEQALPNISLPVPLIALERARPPLRVRQLGQWAQELPIGNTTLASHQMLDKLKILNRTSYGCKDRLQLLSCLRPVFAELLQAIRQPLRVAGIPLDRKLQYSAELVQQLLSEMAGGYKLVAMELAMENSRREQNRMLLAEAVYFAVVYLGQQLVESYSLYTDAPRRTWSDLNQLYLLAEYRNILSSGVDDPYPDTRLPVILNIGFAYQRILLLALSEPYHLMQCEADDMYQVINPFVEACVIEPTTQAPAHGEYLIDLDTDAGPCYSGNMSQIGAKQTRRIDISSVKRLLNSHLQRLLRSSVHEARLEAVSLAERQQRDMLLRLADGWNASLQRKTQRFNLDAKVELTSGLNACHYFVSRGSSFTPEIDALRLAKGLDQVDDAKHTVFATAYREALKKDRRHSHKKYAMNPWWQRNISPIGIALNSQDTDQQLDVRVGELVVYRFSGKQRRRWQVGVIRWLKTGYGEETAGLVNIGIMNLANGAVPVGTKAIKGLGSGTDYFRGLLVPRQVSLQQTRSLIAPALLYDVGSVLVLNIKQRLSHIKLNRVLLSTRSFTQFEFDVIDKPADFIF